MSELTASSPADAKHADGDDLAAAQAEVDQLRVAQRTNRRIGMALGILMAKHGWTEEQAFGALRFVSQRSQRKMHDVAEDLILTGELPSVGATTPEPPS